MRKHDPDEERLRRLLPRLMKLTPPPVEPPLQPQRLRPRRRLWAPTTAVAATLVIVAAVLAATLVQNSHLAATKVSPGVGAASSTSPSPTSPAASSSPSETPETAASVPADAPCSGAAGLVLKQAEPFLSSMEGTWEVWSVTGTAAGCSLSGFPVVSAVNDIGQPVASADITDEAMAASPAAVNVGGTSRDTASFYIYYPVCQATATPQTYTLQLSVPGMTAPVQQTRQLEPSCLSLSVSVISQGLVLPAGWTTRGTPPPAFPSGESRPSA
jgi:hypothetical protein